MNSFLNNLHKILASVLSIHSLCTFHMTTLILTTHYMLNKQMQFLGDWNYSFWVRMPTFLAILTHFGNWASFFFIGICIYFIGICIYFFFLSYYCCVGGTFCLVICVHFTHKIHYLAANPLVQRCFMADNFWTTCNLWEVEGLTLSVCICSCYSNNLHHITRFSLLSK
jgi:hypothetical protein